jgi:O-antigen ligase
MKTFSAAVLWTTIAVSVVVMWVQARWPTSVPEIAAFGLAAVWIVACLIGRSRLQVSPVLIPLGAVVFWGILQIGAGSTVFAWRTKVADLYWAGNLAVVFAALQTFDGSRVRAKFFRALLIFGFAVAVISPLQSLNPDNKVFWLFERPQTFWIPFGPFPYTNQYAAFIELLLPVALFFALTEERWRTFYVLAAAVMYTSVIAAASRMGLALTTAEMLIVPALVARSRKLSLRRIRTAAILFAGIFVMLILAAGPAKVLEKLMADDPYGIRRDFTSTSLEMIQAKPLLGFGLGNWATAYPKFAHIDDGLYANEAHNDWAQWAVEGGLPLFAIMLGLAIFCVPRALRSGWGFGVAAVFVHCLVDYPIQRTAVAVVFFAMIGAICAYGGKEARTID